MNKKGGKMQRLIRSILLAFVAVFATVLVSNAGTQVSSGYTDAWEPSAAMSANGNLVITWADWSLDPLYGIAAQLFDSSGQPILADKIHVNTTIIDEQASPSAAMDANGNFIITWHSLNLSYIPGSEYLRYLWDIYAQRYDSSGNPVGSEFQVNTYTTQEQYEPSVAMDADGNFVIAWQGEGPDGDGIYARLFNNDGNAVERYDSGGNSLGSGEFRVNTNLLNDVSNTSVAMDIYGNFVIAWVDSSTAGNIYARRYDSSGNPVSPEFLVNDVTTDNKDISLAMAANGNFVITWQSGLAYSQPGYESSIYARLYDNDGNPNELEFKVNTNTVPYQLDPSVSMAANGNFVVTWLVSESGVYYPKLYAKNYDSSGNPIVSEYKVNIDTSPNDSYERQPSVAMDANGNFAITWTASDYEGQRNIFMQYYHDSDGDGEPDILEPCSPVSIFDDIPVNNTTSGNQSSPSIAMDDYGNFVIAWQGPDQDGSGIYFQIYDRCGNSVGSELKVITNTTQNQQNPSVAMDKSGSFVITWQGYNQDGSGRGLYTQRYDNIGNPVGPEFGITSPQGPYIEAAYRCPSVVKDANGNLVIASNYGELYDDGAGYSYIQEQIFAHIFDNSGNLQDVFNLGNVAPEEWGYELVCPSATMDDYGNFVITWTDWDNYWNTLPDKANIIARKYVYDSDGNPVGSTFWATATTGLNVDPSAAIAENGDLVITWKRLDGYSWRIYAKRFDSLGDPVGDEFLVNTSTQGGSDPSVAMAANENFVITWVGQGIYTQRYDSLGDPVGDEFLVNTSTQGGSDPSVAMAANENFVIVWKGQDGDGTGIFMKLYLVDQDTDSDGIPDVQDPCPLDNPDDTDNDGVCDSDDICAGFDDNADGDSDGTPDGCDVCPLDNPNDTDNDGICDSDDNCPSETNPDQRDVDIDSAGDVCDVCPADETNGCDQSKSAGESIGSDGGDVTTSDVSIIVPAGALSTETSLSITPIGEFYTLTTNFGASTAIYGVTIEPEGLEFDVPIMLVFTWDDGNDDGIVDGTSVNEDDLQIFKDGSSITGVCKIDPGCNSGDNTFTVYVSSLSDFEIVALKTYKITAIAGSNGSISPESAFVKDSQNQSFIFDPDDNYMVDQVTVNGTTICEVDDVDLGCIPPASPYVVTNITEDITIGVTFKLAPVPPAVVTHTITASAGPNGSISPESAFVRDGQSQIFTFSSAPGYRVAQVKMDDDVICEVDDEDLGCVAPIRYVFTNVSADHSISVSFEAMELSHIPVRLGVQHDPYYYLQDAYAAIPLLATETIYVQSWVYEDSCIFDRDITVTLKGGYDVSFKEPPPGVTAISNPEGTAITIRNGTVIFNNFILR